MIRRSNIRSRSSSNSSSSNNNNNSNNNSSADSSSSNRNRVSGSGSNNVSAASVEVRRRHSCERVAPQAREASSPCFPQARLRPSGSCWRSVNSLIDWLLGRLIWDGIHECPYRSINRMEIGHSIAF